MDSTVGKHRGASEHILFQLAFEQHIVRDFGVVHPIKEVEHLLGDVLTEQVRRVLVLALVRPRAVRALCVKVTGGQLGVGHGQGLGIVQVLDAAQVELVLQIALTGLDELRRGFHIMLAVEYRLLQFFLCQRVVDIEIHGGFLHRHSKVSLDGFQGKTLLGIVPNVHIVEPILNLLHEGVFPPVMPRDQEIVQFLDFFGFTPATHRFHDVLVVAFRVEPDINGIVLRVHELTDTFGVVVEDEELTRLEIHEHDQPVVQEHLKVIDVYFQSFTSYPSKRSSHMSTVSQLCRCQSTIWPVRLLMSFGFM